MYPAIDLRETVPKSGHDRTACDRLYWLVFRLFPDCLRIRGFDWEIGAGSVGRGSNFRAGEGMAFDHHLWNPQTMIYLLFFVYLQLWEASSPRSLTNLTDTALSQSGRSDLGVDLDRRRYVSRRGRRSRKGTLRRIKRCIPLRGVS